MATTLRRAARTLAAWDRRWSQRLRVDHMPAGRIVATIAAHLGDGPLWLLLWGAGYFYFPSPIRQQILIWAVTSVAAAVVTYSIKFMLKRPRPTEVDGFYSKRYDRHAFPSGHATRMGTLPVFGMWIYPQFAWLFWAASLLCIWARTALGVHFLGDVAAGWLIGAIVSLLALAIVAWP